MATPMESKVDERKAVSCTLSVDDVLDFCFPPGVEHPNSTALLVVLGLYGPPYRKHSFFCLCTKCQQTVRDARKTNDDAKRLFSGQHFSGEEISKCCSLCTRCREHVQRTLHLRGGFKGSHILTEHEVSELGASLYREDVLTAHHAPPGLPKQEQSVLLSTVDSEQVKEVALSKEAMSELLSEIPRTDLGRFDFHDLRGFVQDFRAERILRFRGKPPTTAAGILTSPHANTKLARDTLARTGTGLPLLSRSSAPRQHMTMTRTLLQGSNGSGGGGKPLKVPDRLMFAVNQRVLHAHSFQMTSLGPDGTAKKEGGALATNARLLRL